MIAVYIVVFVIAIVCTTGFMIIDGYMKYRRIKDDAEAIAEVLATSEIAGFKFESFTLWSAVRWNLLVPISLIILVILVWCFYFTYQDEIALR